MAAIKYTRPVLPIPQPPIPIPIGFVPQPFKDRQDYEYVQNGLIMNGKTGLPKYNAETGQIYIP